MRQLYSAIREPVRDTPLKRRYIFDTFIKLIFDATTQPTAGLCSILKIIMYLIDGDRYGVQ